MNRNNMGTREIKPIDEMAKDLAEERANMARKNGNIYKDATPETDAYIRQDVAIAAASLAKPRERVNFSDITDVRQRAVDYLTACAQAARIPTVSGLAVHGFGISRQALSQYMVAHENEPVAALIDQVKEVIADCLQSAMLRRKCDNVSGIFILKNSHGFRDNADLPVISLDVGDDETKSVAYYKARYGNIADIEE